MGRSSDRSRLGHRRRHGQRLPAAPPRGSGPQDRQPRGGHASGHPASFPVVGRAPAGRAHAPHSGRRRQGAERRAGEAPARRLRGQPIPVAAASGHVDPAHRHARLRDQAAAVAASRPPEAARPGREEQDARRYRPFDSPERARGQGAKALGGAVPSPPARAQRLSVRALRRRWRRLQAVRPPRRAHASDQLLERGVGVRAEGGKGFDPVPRPSLRVCDSDARRGRSAAGGCVHSRLERRDNGEDGEAVWPHRPHGAAGCCWGAGEGPAAGAAQEGAGGT